MSFYFSTSRLRSCVSLSTCVPSGGAESPSMAAYPKSIDSMIHISSYAARSLAVPGVITLESSQAQRVRKASK